MQVVDNYGSLQRALNGLDVAYHSFDTAFKVYPRIRSEYYLSQAYFYLGEEAFGNRSGSFHMADMHNSESFAVSTGKQFASSKRRRNFSMRFVFRN